MNTKSDIENDSRKLSKLNIVATMTKTHNIPVIRKPDPTNNAMNNPTKSGILSPYSTDFLGCIISRNTRYPPIKPIVTKNINPIVIARYIKNENSLF